MAQEADHYDNWYLWDRGPDRPIAYEPVTGLLFT
jgi:hypothetical protein